MTAFHIKRKQGTDSATAAFYMDGKRITPSKAEAFTRERYFMTGGDPEEFAAVWAKVAQSEEARATVSAWSGYAVEVVVDWA